MEKRDCQFQKTSPKHIFGKFQFQFSWQYVYVQFTWKLTPYFLRLNCPLAIFLFPFPNNHFIFLKLEVVKNLKCITFCWYFFLQLQMGKRQLGRININSLLTCFLYCMHSNTFLFILLVSSSSSISSESFSRIICFNVSYALSSSISNNWLSVAVTLKTRRRTPHF